jgi:hypothetical protein
MSDLTMFLAGRRSFANAARPLMFQASGNDCKIRFKISTDDNEGIVETRSIKSCLLRLMGSREHDTHRTSGMPFFIQAPIIQQSVHLLFGDNIGVKGTGGEREYPKVEESHWAYFVLE